MRPGAVLREGWQGPQGRRRILRIAARLARAYGTPELGNLIDPLDEAVYILLTLQTDIPRARQVWRALRARFPNWSNVLDAPEDEISEVLRPSGLQRQRARIVRRLLQAAHHTFGALTLEPCRGMTTDAAERVLRNLPGLDRKTARCILLYSFDRAVFPVDSNTYRFARRYGILVPETPYRRASVHDDLQELVPPHERRRLHINLVVHGQKTCLPARPLCPTCPVRRGCEAGRSRESPSAS